MKKSLLAVAVLGAFAGAAQAQSNVTMYGVLDVGYMSQTNTGNINNQFVAGVVPIAAANGAHNQTASGFMGNGETVNRVGIKGSEDLGGGLKAIFQLETGFNLGTGIAASSGLAGAAGNSTNSVGGAGPRLGNMVGDTSVEGQLLNRIAMVGLTGNWGTVTGGRQLSLGGEVIAARDYDPVNALMFSPINFSGQYAGGGATDGSRVDNAYVYKQNFGDVNFGAMYAPGGVAGQSSARSTQALNLGYEVAAFGAQLMYSNQKDTTSLASAPAPNTVNVGWLDTKMWGLAFKYRPIEALTLKAGYERMELLPPSNLATDQQVSTVYNYSIGTSTAVIPAGMTKTINTTWLGANYMFSPAVKLSVGLYDVKVPNWGAGNNTGDAKYSSVLLDYILSKRTNAYAGFMHSSASGTSMGGGGAIAGAVDSFNFYGVGLKHAF